MSFDYLIVRCVSGVCKRPLGNLPFSTTPRSGWMTLQKARVESYELCSEHSARAPRFIAEGLLVLT
jgi:hypothetical protein